MLGFRRMDADMYRSCIEEVYVHTKHVLVRFLAAWFVARRWYGRCWVDRRESHGADLEVLGMLYVEPMPLVEHDVFRLCKAAKVVSQMRFETSCHIGARRIPTGKEMIRTAFAVMVPSRRDVKYITFDRKIYRTV